MQGELVYLVCQVLLHVCWLSDLIAPAAPSRAIVIQRLVLLSQRYCHRIAGSKLGSLETFMAESKERISVTDVPPNIDKTFMFFNRGLLDHADIQRSQHGTLQFY